MLVLLSHISCKIYYLSVTGQQKRQPLKDGLSQRFANAAYSARIKAALRHRRRRTTAVPSIGAASHKSGQFERQFANRHDKNPIFSDEKFLLSCLFANGRHKTSPLFTKLGPVYHGGGLLSTPARRDGPLSRRRQTAVLRAVLRGHPPEGEQLLHRDELVPLSHKGVHRL